MGRLLITVIATLILLSSVDASRQQRDLLAAGNSTTQAGCACAASWTHKFNATSAVTVSGCANPDSDPKGAWCPVDKKACVGYYGSYTWLGDTIFFDYCAAVRGVTNKGCICNAVTFDSINQQLPIYDGCTKQNSGSGAWCNVNPKTCKTPPTPVAENPELYYDFCKLPKRVPVLSPPDKTPTTQGGCACAKDWTYWENTKDKSDPFEGCNDPDYDPKGSWCVVNSLTCKAAYGHIKQGKPVYYDYCGNVTDFTRAGCRCKSIWGGGKLMDRCANPDNKALKWCEIMPDTCTQGKPEADTWDFCGPALAAPKNISSSTPAGNPAEHIVVVAAAPSTQKPASKADNSRKYIVIIVPILTGLAALVTIMYTLYKCHKKRTFFKSTALLKIHQLAGVKQQQVAAAAAGSDVDVMPPLPPSKTVV